MLQRLDKRGMHCSWTGVWRQKSVERPVANREIDWIFDAVLDGNWARSAGEAI